MARTWFLASRDWRRESLRTTLWVVPAVEVALAVGLFVVTYALDRAAYRGDIAFPLWVNNGSADAARQILIGIAAAVITVVGLVFSITIVALTLASTQFGPRMLRNFIRDRGYADHAGHLCRDLRLCRARAGVRVARPPW